VSTPPSSPHHGARGLFASVVVARLADSNVGEVGPATVVGMQQYERVVGHPWRGGAFQYPVDCVAAVPARTTDGPTMHKFNRGNMEICLENVRESDLLSSI
jgi:hypothetical protein